jgi:thioredoxin 1
MIAPIFKELSEEMGTRAQFIKVDVDDNPEAAQKYGVSAMPTFLFIKGGEVVDRLMGANTERLREVRHLHEFCHSEMIYFERRDRRSELVP